MSSPAARTDAFPATGRIAGLDGLRALAIGMVILSKLTHQPGFVSSRWLEIFSRQGGLGVDLFFVISGFLITTLLLRERQQSGQIDLTAFYVRRSLRILPAYFLLLIVLAILQAAQWVSISGLNWLAAVTYTVNFIDPAAWDLGHVWSLSVEEHFYLVWPWVVAACSIRRLERIVLASLLLPILLRIAIVFGWPEQCYVVESWTFTRIDTLAAGCGLAILLANPLRCEQLQGWTERLGGWKTAVAGLLLTVLLSASGKFALIPGLLLNGLWMSWLLFEVVRRPECRFTRLLSCRPLTLVGTLSYSIYLWHRLWLRPADVSWDWHWTVCLAGLAVTAVASWWLVETPCLRLKDRWSRRRSQQPHSSPTRSLATNSLPAVTGTVAVS